MIYEYQAKTCTHKCTHTIVCSAAEAPNNFEKQLYDNKQIVCDHYQTYSRVYTPTTISTQRYVHMEGTRSEREFISSRDYEKHLSELAKKQTDYTGNRHDFGLVDRDLVAPKDEAVARQEHDQAVKSGRKESRGRFVHSPIKRTV